MPHPDRAPLALAALTAATAALAPPAAAQATLVKDVNAVPGFGSSNGSGEVKGVTDSAGTAYFSADDGIVGAELWKSDGTTAGTVLVSDINPGVAASSPRDLVAAGRYVFFAATGSTGGEELYRTNGTAAGTILLKDINTKSPTAGSVIGRMIAVGDQVFFSAWHSSYGEELWKSNGTPAGTVLVKDVFRGRTSSFPNYLVAVGGTVFFQADTGTNGTGRELWKSDGTAVGTVLVKDIYLGRSSSSPTDLTAVGGTVFFRARDGQSGDELWTSDGTAAGTALVKDLRVGPGSSSPIIITAVGDRVFFNADSTVGSTTSGQELHVSDGTAAGTFLVAEIQAGPAEGKPGQFTALGQRVVFTAIPPGGLGALGYEPYVSDGTAAGTKLLRDIVVGPTGSLAGNLLATGDRFVYFTANDLGVGMELWRTDGTTAGTVLAADVYAGAGSSSPGSLAVTNGRLLFGAWDNVIRRELWSVDPGANAVPVGTGCIGVGPVPRLTVSDPVLGASSAIAVAHATPATPGLLLTGLAGPAFLLGGSCFLYYNPAAPSLVVPLSTDGGGRWALSVPIPALPSLAGIVLSMQAGILSPSTPPTGLALSKAVFLTPGV